MKRPILLRARYADFTVERWLVQVRLKPYECIRKIIVYESDDGEFATNYTDTSMNSQFKDLQKIFVERTCGRRQENENRRQTEGRRSVLRKLRGMEEMFPHLQKNISKDRGNTPESKSSCLVSV